MTHFVWSAPVHLPRNASVVVREALVPMLLWPSVPVIRLVYEDLTVIDRFMVEAAMALMPMRVEDVEEVTTIPRDAVIRIAGRLTGLGLLRADGDDYYPIETAALAALERRAAPEHRKAFLTFLYLPATDEMVAFEPRPGRPQHPLLQKVKTVHRAPLPRKIVGVDRTELVRDRIRTRQIAELPEDIVDAVDASPEQVVPDSCPAYRCAGHVRSRSDGITLVLDVLDGDGKRATQCQVPGAVRQAAAWIALAEQAESAGQGWQAEGGHVVAAQDSTATWTYLLDRAAAEAAANQGITLSQPTGLLIHNDEATVVGVNARFRPADDGAIRIFALHHAMRTLTDKEIDKLGPETITAAAAAARSAYGLSEDQLTEAALIASLWTYRYYRHVYAIRATQDFPYD